MMQPALRRCKINEETNLGVERGGSVQKNRSYRIEKKNSGRELLGIGNQSDPRIFTVIIELIGCMVREHHASRATNCAVDPGDNDTYYQHTV